MRDEGTNTDDRVVDVLGKLVPHRSADFIIGSAVVPVGRGEALKVRDRFDIPDDQIAHVTYR
jgi:hypothetical protein